MKIAVTLVMASLALAGRSLHADDKWDIRKMDVNKLPPAAEAKGVAYAKDIRPMLFSACIPSAHRKLFLPRP